MEYGMPFDFDSSAPNPEEYQYTAAEQRTFNMAMFTNGVFPQVRLIQGSVLDPSIYIGQSLNVTVGTGMQIVISKGMAALEGIQYINTEEKKLPIQAGTIAKTIDIIIELDLIAQKVVAKAQNRTNGILPQNALTRSNYLYQIMIATISLPANATTISSSYIIDQRLNTSICPIDGKPVCGLANSSMQADTRVISEQLTVMLQENKRTFDSWFASLGNILDANAAGNLLNKINAPLSWGQMKNGRT